MSAQPKKNNPPSPSLNHALHNESCCTMLVANGGYQDWVITTAFYSSLHFVKHKLFPLHYDGDTYANFDEYCRFIKRRSGSHIHPHEIQRELVARFASHISADYEGLYDLCWSARYHNYQLDDEFVEEALAHLKSIKRFCYNERLEHQADVANENDMEDDDAPPSVKRRARRPRIS